MVTDNQPLKATLLKRIFSKTANFWLLFIVNPQKQYITFQPPFEEKSL